MIDMEGISDKPHLQMCLIKQYYNTPILDKVSSPKDLPKNVEDYLIFDMEKNLEYALKIQRL